MKVMRKMTKNHDFFVREHKNGGWKRGRGMDFFLRARKEREAEKGTMQKKRKKTERRDGRMNIGMQGDLVTLLFTTNL